jgi:hypothetical protein
LTTGDGITISAQLSYRGMMIPRRQQVFAGTARVVGTIQMEVAVPSCLRRCLLAIGTSEPSKVKRSPSGRRSNDAVPGK